MALIRKIRLSPPGRTESTSRPTQASPWRALTKGSSSGGIGRPSVPENLPQPAPRLVEGHAAGVCVDEAASGGVGEEDAPLDVDDEEGIRQLLQDSLQQNLLRGQGSVRLGQLGNPLPDPRFHFHFLPTQPLGKEVMARDVHGQKQNDVRIGPVHTA